MSSFTSDKALRTCSSSLESTPKVFQTAGFAFCQAGDKGGGWQHLSSVLKQALKTIF